MSKFEFKPEVIKLRKNGYSINEISNKMKLSKSTISAWCREVELTTSQREKLKIKMIKAGHKGRLKGAQTNHDNKIKQIMYYRKVAKLEMPKLIKDPFFCTGLSLYWAEGTKKDNRFVFTNSDPLMIKLMISWLGTYFLVEGNLLMPRLYVNHIHKHNLTRILTFWGALLKLPSKQFGTPVLLRVNNKKVYNNPDSYRGLISLRVRNSTPLLRQLMAYLEVFKEKMSG